MTELLKDKKIITIILAIVLIVLEILTYPYKVRVDNGEIKCSNALGQTVKCR